MKIKGWIIEDEIKQDKKSGRSVVIAVSKVNPFYGQSFLFAEAFYIEDEIDFDFYNLMWNEIPKHKLIYAFLCKKARILYSGTSFKNAYKAMI